MPRRQEAAGRMLQGEVSSEISSNDDGNNTGRTQSQESTRKSSRISQITPRSSSHTTPRISAQQRSPQGRRQQAPDPRETPSTSRENPRSRQQAPDPRETPSTSRENPRSRPPPPPRTNPPGRRRRKQSRPKKDKYTNIRREIKYYQKTTKLLIPRAPFSRTVKECIQSFGDYRVTTVAFDALQEATEMYLTQLLEDAYKCTIFRRCVTLHPKDIQLVRYLRGCNDPTA